MEEAGKGGGGGGKSSSSMQRRLAGHAPPPAEISLSLPLSPSLSLSLCLSLSQSRGAPAAALPAAGDLRRGGGERAGQVGKSRGIAGGAGGCVSVAVSPDRIHARGGPCYCTPSDQAALTSFLRPTGTDLRAGSRGRQPCGGDNEPRQRWGLWDNERGNDAGPEGGSYCPCCSQGGTYCSCCSQRTCMFTNEISMLQECCCQHPGNARGDHSPPARIVLGASVPLELYATCQCVRDGANGRRREGRLGPQGNGGQACDARDCDELRSNNPCGCGPPHRWHQRGRE